jgi:PAS domain S-box-containing protein
MGISSKNQILIMLQNYSDREHYIPLLGARKDYALSFVLTKTSCLEKIKTIQPKILILDIAAIEGKIELFLQLIYKIDIAIKIILIGYNDDEFPFMEGIRAGADYFIFKHNLEKLPDTINRLISSDKQSYRYPEQEKIIESINAARYHILEYSNTHPVSQTMQEALDQICKLTQSEIGFFHFVEPDQKTLSLQAWSTKTIQSYCKAEAQGMHYNIDKAGVWVDCIHERRPIIHNNYNALPNKKGLPEGHASVIRELVVPIFRDSLIVAVLGVGNKPIDYDDEDTKIVSIFADLVWDINARRQAETKLKAAETRFQSFIENANENIFLLDQSGIFTYISPNWQETLGLIPKNTIGLSYEDFIHPDDIPVCQKFINEIYQTGGKKSGVEYRVKHKDGKWHWHLTNASIIKDSESQQPVLLGISHDISAIKNTEEKLMKSEASIRKRLKAITSPTGNIDTLKLADILDCEAIQSLMDDFYALTNYGIGIIDFEGNILVKKGWQNICTKFHRTHPETLANCLQSDDQLTKDVEPGMFNFYKCKNNMWDISAPLMLNDRHVGNVFLGQFFFDDEFVDEDLFRQQARKYGFDENAYMEALNQVPRWNANTVSTVMSFYTKLSTILSSISLSNIQLAKSISEKDQLLIALGESEERYHKLVESSPSPIFIVKNGKYQYGNPAGLRILGYESLAAFNGTNVLESIHPDYHSVVLERMKSLKKGNSNSPLEMVVLNKNGGFCYTESTSVPISLNGEQSILILSHDISERKQAEEKLQAANTRLHALWNVSSLTDINDPKIISDHILETITRMTGSRYGFYGFINEDETAMTIHSWSGQGMKECNINEKPMLFPIHDAGIWADAVRNRKPLLLNNYLEQNPNKKGLPIGHVPIQNLLVIPCFSNNRINAVAAVANSYFDYTEDDVLQINTFLTNVQMIVDRTRAENARKKSETLLNESQQLTQTGAWEWDQSLQTMTWTDEVFHIHGFNPDEMMNGSAELVQLSLDCYYPEDRPLIQKAFDNCRFNGEAYALDLRFQTKQGENKWVNTIGNPLFEDGKVLRINGYIMDITRQKISELKLQKQQSVLETSQEIAHLGSYEYEIDTDSYYWTKEAFHIFGLFPDQQVPTNEEFKKIIFPEDVDSVKAAYQISISSRESFDIVYRIIRSDGAIRYIHSIGTPEFDQHGKPIRFSGTFQDITTSKSLELELKKSVAEQEVLMREIHHRVKNNLAAILGLIEMEKNSSSTGINQKVLGNLAGRIKSIAAVHETLYKSNNLSKISIQKYLESFIVSLQTSIQNAENTMIHIDAGKIELDINFAIPCGLIINELVTNALKYAFPLEPSGKPMIEQPEIWVSFKEVDRQFKLSVADNGIGLPDKFDLHTCNTLGLKLVNMLGEHQLNGKLSLDTNHGTNFTLTFNPLTLE